ncbi:angiogenic factor with G patch and FHA domains 1 isoform X2 [Lethenteron reissneri]|uniref:angiogenic factor with G patch and FHA domains 1 isoform X2 n=1 Tax=Lethenteron reissneri TaxID=7753 RepID=UPI002AB67E0C|nr:angiogenic factor with G patch and FHA domains 1 isoform X2 [Lethenteron reissneri]
MEQQEMDDVCGENEINLHGEHVHVENGSGGRGVQCEKLTLQEDPPPCGTWQQEEEEEDHTAMRRGESAETQEGGGGEETLTLAESGRRWDTGDDHTEMQRGEKVDTQTRDAGEETFAVAESGRRGDTDDDHTAMQRGEKVDTQERDAGEETFAVAESGTRDTDDEFEEDGVRAEELSDLPEDAEILRRELILCRKRLQKAEQLHGTVQRYNDDLRAQVEVLSKQVHELKKCRRQKTNAETQTDDSAYTAQLGYEYGLSEYQSVEAAESEQQQPQQPLENSTSRIQDPTVEAAAAEAEAEGVSLADSLRAAAEDAMQQSGMVYDEGTGLYYDYTTGFYYDATTQMYYDPNNGHYYYFDSEKGTYEYYTSVDLQPAEGTTKTKKKKTKKKDLEKEEKARRSPKRRSRERKRGREAERERSKKRLKTSGRHHRKAAVDCITDDEDEERERREKRRRRRRRSSSTERGSETEEGEISDSEDSASTSSHSSSDSSTQSNVCDDSEEQQWPPCIRVMVVRSPVLNLGTLFIITSDTIATIGRAKDMDHTISIPEMGVSKFHAEVHFDPERQKYVLMDQGSQNGTIINGNRILQPKEHSDPHPLDHGDEVKFGETVLSFHIHPASETCDGCEPGQVIAHLRLNQKQAPQTGFSLLSKKEKEKIRLKELKQMKAKYGLQGSAHEDQEVLNNSKYANRAEQRRRTVGSEHPHHKDDAPASLHEEIDRGNKGRKLLEKMGWKHGEGLGRDSAGIKEPIKPHAMNKQAGLGSAPQLPADSPLLAAGNSRRAQNWEKARERFESFATQKSKAAPHPPKKGQWVLGSGKKT